jgi:hypothetical protein
MNRQTFHRLNLTLLKCTLLALLASVLISHAATNEIAPASTPPIAGNVTNPPAPGVNPLNLINTNFPDGSGRRVTVDKERSILAVRDKEGKVLWAVDMAAKYELKRQSIYSLKLIKNNTGIEVIATPGASMFYFDSDTGKFRGATFMHQTQETH